MTPKQKGAALKVCRTCRYWSDKHKGVCTRVQQGAGQFWVCDEWLELPDAAANPQEKDEPGGRTN
ncbi:MAG: hypothetical protein AB1424_13310 [Thermodesulfobacteriota bacterium]